ncbi:MAG: TonB-dependent receptor, partial [Janthinobacterium sp.]
FISNYGHQRALLYATADADLSRDTTLSAGFHVNDERNPGSTWYGLPTALDGSFLPLQRSASNAPDWTFWNKKNTRLFAEVEHRLASGWQVKLAAQALDDELDSIVTGIARVPKTNLFRLSAANAFIYDRQQRILDAQVSGPFSLLGRRHEIVFGASYRTRDSEDKGYKSVPDYSYTFNPVKWDTRAPVKPDINTFYYGQDTRTTQKSAYATARFSLADPLRLVLGGRFGWYAQDVTGWYASTPTWRRDLTESAKFTPYAGLVYDLGRHWSAYASYTSIFTPQSQRDVNSRFLAPLEGKNYEVGAKGEFFGGKLTTSAAVFQLKQENLAEADPGNVWIIGTGGGSYAYHTVKGATTRGVEAEVSGQLRPDWQLTASYAYSRIRNAAGARIQTNQPQNMAKLWTTWRLAQGVPGLVLGGGVNWQSDIYMDDRGPNGERFTQKAYAVAGLMAQYPLSPQLVATLNVNNVFDKQYYSTGMGGYYGDPRNAMLSLRYKF